MPLIYIIILLVTFQIILLLLFFAKVSMASDQSIHILFIDLIRKNKHRLISVCDSFLIQNKMTYPQFVHWFFSFVPKHRVGTVTSCLPFIFSTISLVLFIFFVVGLSSDLLSDQISLEKLLFLSGLLFISTPFTYNINSAKNVGISARGFGLFLGQLYTYSLVLYLLHHSTIYLWIAAISALFIFMSSQFASQYILFSTLLLAIFYQSLTIFIPLVGSVISYFIISPKIASQFFSGNFGHKKFYYKYLAERLLFTYRESVWKDIFWEIWKLLFTRNKPKGGGTKFMYIYNNPAIVLIFSLPLTIPVVYYTLVHSADSAQHRLITLLGIPVVASLVLFVLFSFRKTRFLGEPERYVEFIIGFTSVITVILFHSQIVIIYCLICYQVACVLAQAFIAKYRTKIKMKSLVDGLNSVNNSIATNFTASEEIRLLSNNTEIMRVLTDSTKKVFYGSLYSEWYGKFHYAELYHTFDRMKDEMILPVILGHKINCFVLDINFFSSTEFETACVKSSVVYEKFAVKDNLVAYKISAY